jgi:hypothetical protein
VGIRNINKFSQFITYLQVVPTEGIVFHKEFALFPWLHKEALIIY